MVLSRSAAVLAGGVLLLTGAPMVGAQTANTRAVSTQATSVADDVPLDEYLRALAAINPAARDGAQAYMDAYRSRCGRALPTLALRRAVAEGDGDPALMAMMRASHYRDNNALAKAAAGIRCGEGR